MVRRSATPSTGASTSRRRSRSSCDDTDTIFSTHNWPRFGNDDARRYLEQQRDLYRWLHDQTVRLDEPRQHPPRDRRAARACPSASPPRATPGATTAPISHNSKAVYQRYIGWYDGNPANLNPHTPENSGARYVEAMGGADAVRRPRPARRSTRATTAGCVELLNHVVFAEPDHEEARLLQADAYEQLGYQAESGPWRDSYLMGALELRTGMKGLGLGIRAVSDELDRRDAVRPRRHPPRRRRSRRSRPRRSTGASPTSTRTTCSASTTAPCTTDPDRHVDDAERHDLDDEGPARRPAPRRHRPRRPARRLDRRRRRRPDPHDLRHPRLVQRHLRHRRTLTRPARSRQVGRASERVDGPPAVRTTARVVRAGRVAPSAGGRGRRVPRPVRGSRSTSRSWTPGRTRTAPR